MFNRLSDNELHKMWSSSLAYQFWKPFNKIKCFKGDQFSRWKSAISLCLLPKFCVSVTKESLNTNKYLHICTFEIITFHRNNIFPKVHISRKITIFLLRISDVSYIIQPFQSLIICRMNISNWQQWILFLTLLNNSYRQRALAVV